MDELERLKAERKRINEKIKELSGAPVYKRCKIDFETYPTRKPTRHFVAIKYYPIDGRAKYQTIFSALGKEFCTDEEIAELEQQFIEYAKKKRNWENAFQKWSDKHGMNTDNTEDYGCCGYGSMCDWCEDNSYGRPCVRALNKMCREKGIYLNYESRDFVKVWQGIAESEEE